MFKNEFQGGPYFEIFGAQGKDPIANWKLTGGSGVRKVYDKEVKSYVYTLEGSTSTTRMQIPKDPKQSLTLIQQFIIFQIWIPKGGDFSIELAVTDLGNNKRRLNFSTTSKGSAPDPLHAKISLSVIKRGIWMNLCLDMVSLVKESWRGQTYKAIEGVSISANCRVRRIFTMKVQPPDTTDDEELYGLSGTNSCELDTIPRQCQLPVDVTQVTQVLNMTKIRQADWKIRGGDPASRPTSSSDIDLNASGRKSSNEPYHIAFGSKIAAKTPGSARAKGSAGKAGSSSSRTSRSSHSRSKGSSDHQKVDKLVVHQPTNHNRNTSDPGSLIEDPDTSVDKGTLGGSRTWQGAIDVKDEQPLKPSKQPSPLPENLIQPHPPRGSSGDRLRRRARVKSPRQIETVPGVQNSENSHATSQHYEPLPVKSSGTQLTKPYSPRVRGGSLSSDKEEFLAERRANMKSAGVQSPREWSEEDAQEELRGSHRFSRLTPKKDMGVGPEDERVEESEPQHRHIDAEEDGDESMSDVIAALRDNINLQINAEDDDDGFGEYEDSEGEDQNSPSKEEADEVYTYFSKPKTAPRKSPNHVEAARVRRSSKTSAVKSTRRESDPDEDFINSHSSEDDKDMREKLLRHTPSPRQNNSSRTPRENNSNLDAAQSGNFNSLYYEMTVDANEIPIRSAENKKEIRQSQSLQETRQSHDIGGPKHEKQSRILSPHQRNKAQIPRIQSPRVSEKGPRPSSSKRTKNQQSSNESNTLTGSKQFSSGSDNSATLASGDKNVALLTTKNLQLLNTGDSDEMEYLKTANSGGSLNSPRSSQSRMSINKRSLREIPKDDARLSQATNRPYDFKKYQMQEMTDSFEAHMLANLKKQQQDSVQESYEDKNSKSSNQGSHGNNLAKHIYNDDGLSDSSDDTSFSTFRGPGLIKSHHYQDEMHLPESRMSHGDSMNSSNPRDWTQGGAFSPAIVLPSEIKTYPDHLELSQGNMSPLKDRRKSSSPEGKRGRLPSHHDDETEGEDVLDLLYDPCLNCYFDPKTCKYYELV